MAKTPLTMISQRRISLLTNQGALSMETGIRPAPAQLGNRLRRFALRFTSVLRGDQARKLVGTDSTLGNRLQSFLGYWDR